MIVFYVRSDPRVSWPDCENECYHFYHFLYSVDNYLWIFFIFVVPCLIFHFSKDSEKYIGTKENDDAISPKMYLQKYGIPEEGIHG